MHHRRERLRQDHHAESHDGAFALCGRGDAGGGKAAFPHAEHERARHFAYIPQAHTPPFPFSVADVVLMGRTPYINKLAQTTARDRQIAYQALELLGIVGLAEQAYTNLSAASSSWS